MKKYIFTLLTAISFIIVGCDDYLDRPQLSTIEDSDSFWRNESDFRLYSTDFYTWFFPGYNTGFGVNYTPLRGYNFSDDVTATGTQENFTQTVPGTLQVMVDNTKLNDQSWLREYAGERWNYGWVRKANIMIQRVEQYKANLTTEAYNHWMGVARFFRAYAYYNLVLTFGDVPYFDKPVDESNKDEMWKDRTPRGEVMDHVMADLQYAWENTYVKDNNSTQYVNKYLIAGIASRILLFEGTYEKYHNIDASRSQKYLQACVAAAEVVMNSGKYSCTKDFHSIFGSNDLAGHPEVIFYRHYVSPTATHCIASYSNGVETVGYDPNLALIKSFICNDGKPYQSSSVEDADNFSIENLAKTRDPRFEASFFNFALSSSTTLLYGNKLTSRAGTKYYNHYTDAPYEFISSTNIIDAPVLRYAEVLLDWIEAKAELGSVTQGDIDKSINAIRNRPLDEEAISKGVKKTAPLLLNNLPEDPARDSDVSALIWEIRRERRMEFVFEHTRLLDLKRWGKIKYMDNNVNEDTMYGPWVNVAAEIPEVLYDKTGPINKGVIKVKNAAGVEITWDGTNAAQLVGFYKVKNVKPRDQFNYERTYVSPVGSSQIQDYKDHGYTLTQTAAWQ